MKTSPFLIGVAAAISVAAKAAAAASLFANASVGGQLTSIPDPVLAEAERSGFGSLDDLNEDVAAARADLVAGELKYRVLDGGVFSGAPVAGATANASMRENLILSSTVVGVPEIVTVGLSFNATVDTSIGTAGGTFNERILADGTSASGEFRYTLIESGIVNGVSRNALYDLRANFSQTTSFIFNNQGVLTDQFFFVEPNGVASATPAPLLPDPVSRVVDTRARFDVVSPFFYAGILEIDLLLDGPHPIEFIASVTGNVDGAAAFSAGIDSFNSSELFVDGGTFTSASGLFLTAPPPAAVPLPASGLLLGGVLAAGLGAASRRGRSARAGGRI